MWVEFLSIRKVRLRVYPSFWVRTVEWASVYLERIVRVSFKTLQELQPALSASSFWTSTVYSACSLKLYYSDLNIQWYLPFLKGSLSHMFPTVYHEPCSNYSGPSIICISHPGLRLLSQGAFFWAARRLFLRLQHRKRSRFFVCDELNGLRHPHLACAAEHNEWECTFAAPIQPVHKYCTIHPPESLLHLLRLLRPLSWK